MSTAESVEGRRAERGATSLVYYHQTVAAEDESSTCSTPRPGVRLYNLQTGQVKPVPCARLRCPPCASYLAWRRALAMAWARPERRFELTQIGDEWDTVRARVKRFRHRIEERGYTWEHAWMVEPNPRGTGHHLHGYQSGSYVPQAVVSEVADREGMGFRTWIQALGDKSATSYGLKALTYGLKGMSRAESHEEHLALNGRRLCHHSRGFYGVPVREAERKAVEHRRSGPPEWVVTTVGELDRVMPRKVPRP